MKSRNKKVKRKGFQPIPINTDRITARRKIKQGYEEEGKSATWIHNVMGRVA